MRALLLSGGYGTRLGPLTLDRSKPLMPVAGKPMLEHILEGAGGIQGGRGIFSVGCIDQIYIVTNQKFYQRHLDWKANYRYGNKINEIFNDGTMTVDDRLGATGDIIFTLKKIGDEEPTIIVGGDNITGMSYPGCVHAFFDTSEQPMVAAKDVGSKELVKQYNDIWLEDGQIVGFVEKPKEPKGTVSAICLYMYPDGILEYFNRYEKINREDKTQMDAPGRFIQWLHKETPTYAHIFHDFWVDVGMPIEWIKANIQYGNEAFQNKIAEFARLEGLEIVVTSNQRETNMQAMQDLDEASLGDVGDSQLLEQLAPEEAERYRDAVEEKGLVEKFALNLAIRLVGFVEGDSYRQQER